jgi:hypothetical protein
MDHQVRRIEQMVHRAESVLAQMTIAISRMGSGGYGGGGGGPRRHVTSGGGGSEQNTVLLEIFKENLRLRGIEIDENPPAAQAEAGEGAGAPAAESAPASQPESSGPDDSYPRSERPESPLSAQASSSGQFENNSAVDSEPENNRGET